MSPRTFWMISLALILLGWLGLLYFTGGVPPSDWAALAVVPLLALAVTGTAAPLIWLAGRRLGAAVSGETPGAALRVSGWLGLWVAACLGLRLFAMFNWALALTLAVILGLAEGFVRQATRGMGRRTEKGRVDKLTRDG